jgi:parvulin-like peptidyl-prolyl isomerase
MRMMTRVLGTWIIGLATAGLAAAQTPPAQDRPIAIVNGEKIMASDLRKMQELDPPSPLLPTNDQTAERNQTSRDMLIDDLLLRQFLRKNATAPSAADIAREVQTLQDALDRSKPRRTMEDFLKDSGQTLEQLRADIATRLQWRSYITTRLPDEAMKKYYDANKVFFDKVFVKARHILLRLPPKADAAEKDALRAKLSTLRQEIVSGKIDFVQAAKTNSDCPSKQAGGDIGFFPYKFAVAEPFAKAAFALKVNEISDIVETEFGYHIIQVTEIKQGEPSTFEKVKDLVRDVYVQEQEVFQNLVSELRKNATIVIPKE